MIDASKVENLNSVSFPDITPSLVSNLGPLALGYVLLEGASGYFRMHAVQQYLESGQLHLVPGAPYFSTSHSLSALFVRQMSTPTH
jgi:hypothetical protein